MIVVGTVEPNDRAGGFSLPDVLVGLVLLSVIAGLMTGFVGQFGILKRVQTETTAKVEIEALANFLAETISGAMPLHLIDPNPERRFPLEGNRDRIRFTGLMSKGLAAHQLREIVFALDSGAGLQDLVQRMAPRRYASAAEPTPQDTELLGSKISQLRFSFLEPVTGNAKPQWIDSWTERSDLPTAVEITVMARRGGHDISITKRTILRFATADRRQ